MAGDLGGDDRLVAFMQYLRVLVVALLTPLLVPRCSRARRSAGGGAPGRCSARRGLGAQSGPRSGAAARAALRIPAPLLLGPLILTSVLTLTGVTTTCTCPPLLREVGFSLSASTSASASSATRCAASRA